MQNEENWDEISKDIVESKLQPVRAVYVDLTLIKDIRFMAYLLLDQSKERYTKIMQEVSAYNKRYDHEVIKHFSLRDYTEKDIADYIDDITNHPKLNFAPETKVFPFILQTIDEIMNHNAVCKNAPNNIIVYFNTKNIKLTNDTKTYYQHMFKHNIGVELHFLSREFNEIDEDTLRSIDFFFLDNLPEYLKVEDQYLQTFDKPEDCPDPENMKNIFAKLFYKLIFQKKRIIASIQIVDGNPDMIPDDIINRTHTVLSMFAEFAYIDKVLI